MRNDLITMKGGTPVPAKGSALISVSKGVSAIRKPLEELAGKMKRSIAAATISNRQSFTLAVRPMSYAPDAKC